MQLAMIVSERKLEVKTWAFFLSGQECRAGNDLLVVEWYSWAFVMSPTEMLEEKHFSRKHSDELD